MAKLVLGTDKSVRIPAIVKEVPTPMPLSIQKTKDANNKLVNGASTVIDLTGVTDVGDYVLYCAYYYNISITGAVDLSSLTTISGANACQYMFYGCTGIASVNLSNLTTVSAQEGCGSMFSGCTGLTSVNLSSLTTINRYGCSAMFQNCTGLTSVDLSSLTTVSDTSGCVNMFRGCTSLTTLSFPALTSTSFGSYTNQFNNMLSGVTGCTVHFPSNLQSVIGSWTSVTAGFGGTNTTVLFDLPETN